MAIYKAGAIIANRYQVLQGPHENLGLKGGMGIVYLCIDHGENKRPVALKTFQPQYLSNRVVRNSFLREGTTWVDLGQHPHIVQAYEVIDARHGLEIYFVLELVVAAEGKGDASLYAWLLKGPLSLEQSLLFGLQIARGMMHATSQIPHLVHRDLKPGNILIGRDGLARVTDFGLARAMVGDEGGEGTAGEMGEQEGKNTAGEERKQVDTGAKGIAGEEFDTGEKESALTGTKETKELFSEKLVRLIWGKVRSYFSTSQRDAAKPSLVQGIEEMPRPRTQLTQQGIAGTPPYMPPAQWLNEELDARADIYAFGCILQEMITGQRAAPGDSLLQLEQIHLTGQLRPLPAKTPPSVRTLIQNCVALDKSKRYPNWQAVESAITTTYLKSTGQEPPPPPTVADATRADQIATGWSYNNMGLAYQNISQYKNAIGYFERAIEIGQAEAEPELEAAGLGNLGGSYRMLGEYERAIGYYEQHLTIARQIGDRAGEGAALGNLGNAYFSLGEPQKAIDYYEQRLAIARQIGDRSGEGRALGNLGNAYADLDDLKRAIDYYEQGLAISRQIGDRAGEGTALGNLGIAYKNLGEHELALDYYKQQLAITRQLGDVMGVAITSYNITLLLRQQGQLTKALPYAEYAAQVFTKVGHPEYAEYAQKEVAEIKSAIRNER